MENQPTADIDLRRYLAILRNRAWILVVMVIAGAALGFGYSRLQRPVYEASTTFQVDEALNSRNNPTVSSIDLNQRLAQTYAQLITARPLLTSVVDKLKLGEASSTAAPEDALRRAVSVEVVRSTNLVRVRVRDGSAERAAAIANALVDALMTLSDAQQSARYDTSRERLQLQIDLLDTRIKDTLAQIESLDAAASTYAASRNRLEAELSQLRQNQLALSLSLEQLRLSEAETRSTIAPIEPAVPPTSPVSPGGLLLSLLGGVIGLLLAVGGVFAVEALDNTVKDPDALAAATDLPVLGLIGHVEPDLNVRMLGGEMKPVVIAFPRSPIAEAFRILRTNIAFAGVDRPMKTLMVTSSVPGEGKSMIAANLAAALAQGESSVALVDTDLRRPVMHRRFDLANDLGLCSLLTQANPEPGRVAQRTEVPSLMVITSGGLPPNPAELLGSEKLGGIVARLREKTSYVVLDTPPALSVTDARVMSRHADGVLLVVRVGVTQMPAIQRSVDELRRLGANLIGIVINDVPARNSRYGYAYEHYYRESYHTDGARAGAGRTSGALRRAPGLARAGAFAGGLPARVGDAWSNGLRPRLAGALAGLRENMGLTPPSDAAAPNGRRNGHHPAPGGNGASEHAANGVAAAAATGAPAAAIELTPALADAGEAAGPADNGGRDHASRRHRSGRRAK